MIDAVAKIGDTFYDTLVEAVAAVPESSEETTTILLLKDTSELVNIGANKNVILDLNDKTVSNLDSTNVIINDGTLTIRNGTVYCSAEQGAINNESTGVLVIDGARIIGTGRQAIYNNGGETTINEGSYLKSTSVNRATVQNLSSGTVRIKGGTIISTKFSAVISTATLIIGEKGGETSNSSPVIQGESYGIDNTSSKTPIYFYDGVLKGKNKGIAVENKITEIEPEYELITKSEVIEGSTYTISFLGHGVTVTFNPDGGTAEFTTKSVPEGFEIGTLPGASKTGYTFLGWFDSDNNPISPSTIIEENVTYIAHWLKTTGVAQIGNNVYDTLQQAINASNSTGTTITLLKNTSEAITVAASKNVILNMGEYTLSNNGNKAVIENKGTISINGGTIASTATTGAINQVSGTVTINNARVVATGTRQALYITGGTAIITGDSYLESSTDGVYSNMDRCTVQNVTGTLKIYGGTIVGKKQHAVGNADILEIGTQDGNINTSSPNLMGAIYGVKNTGTFRFYDGIIKGASAAINGTVTEQCLPFSSGGGQITAECPKETCQDGSKVKRYFSQNAYSTGYFVTKNNYYDVVTLIIDQLINKGPVISNIYVCEDFQNLNRNPGLCTNKTIYRYDNKSDFIGGHVVVIVGYGFMDNKFYWQIQNSWGPNACDKGFIKIEFGQIGIENVAFSEPYLEEEGKEPYEIKLKYKKMEGNCNIEISLEDVTDIEKWENSLEINFESEDKKTNFNYQCGILNSVKVDKKLVCYYEYMNWLRPKNYFNYKGFKSLGKDNTFNLGTSVSEIKSFEYYVRNLCFRN